MPSKILLLYTLFFSLTGLAAEINGEVNGEVNEYSIVPNINVITGKKCDDGWSATDECKNSTHYIIRDAATGAPLSVTDVNTCEGKDVTWTYDPASIDALGAPKFALLFYPEFPGNNPKSPYSEDYVDGLGQDNQSFSVKTKKLKKADEPECINYMVIIPTKGILDPVFIIDK